MKQNRLNIVTKTEKYPIIIGSNLTSSVSKIFKLNSIEFDKLDKIRTLLPEVNKSNLSKIL